MTRRILNKQDVRAVIQQDTAALGKDRLFGIGKQFLDVFALDVVQLEAFGAGRFEIADLLFGFILQLFLGGDFITRRDQDHVPVLAHV